MKKATILYTLPVVLSLVLSACGASAASAPTAAPAAAQEPTAAEAPTEAEEPTEEVAVSEETTEETAPEAAMIFSMVTDQNGLGDQGFNDTTWSGIQLAATDFGATPKILESSEQAQYVPNLTSLAQEGDNLVVGAGSLLSDAMTEVAPQFPDINFVLVDASVDSPNVQGLVFREQEGAFLGGVMAGMMTESNVIGVLGGMEIPPVVRWITGFQAGVMTVNPDAQVIVSYAGSFSDPAKGKEIALNFFDQNADIVFEVSGGTGIGAFQAATEKGEGYYVMGTDTCKYSLAPDNSLPDVVKRVDVAVYDAAQEVANGTFQGGEVSLGLAEDAMGLCADTYGSLPDDVKAAVETAQAGIVDGSIVPPTDADSLAAFVAPDL